MQGSGSNQWRFETTKLNTPCRQRSIRRTLMPTHTLPSSVGAAPLSPPLPPSAPLSHPQVMNGAILQQGFVVEFIVENHMCLDCTRANTNANTWSACVQVRFMPLAPGSQALSVADLPTLALQRCLFAVLVVSGCPWTALMVVF